MGTLNKALPWFAFMLAVFYLPGVMNASVVPKFTLLSLVLPLLLFFTRRPTNTPINWLLLGLITLGFLSLTWAMSKPEVVPGLWELVMFAGCIYLGQAITGHTFIKTLRYFSYGLIPTVIVMLGQHYLNWGSFIGMIDGVPSGLFVNGRLTGETLALGAAAMLPENMALAGLYLLFAIVAGSRNGEIALFVASGVYFWRFQTLRTVLWTYLLSMVAISTVIYTTLYRGCEGLYCTVNALGSGRVDLWRDTIGGLTWLGRGIGNYYVAFPEMAQIWTPLAPARPEQAHNDFLQMFFELGVPGGLLFVAIFVYSLTTRASYSGVVCKDEAQARVRALLVAAAFASECLFGFQFHLPCGLFIGGLALGFCARSGVPIWDRLRKLHLSRPDDFPSGVHGLPTGLRVVVRQDGSRRGFGALGSLLLAPRVQYPTRGSIGLGDAGSSESGS